MLIAFSQRLLSKFIYVPCYKNVLSDTMGYLDTYMRYNQSVEIKMVKINGHFEA